MMKEGGIVSESGQNSLLGIRPIVGHSAGHAYLCHDPFDDMRPHRRLDRLLGIASHQIDMAYPLVHIEHVILDPLRGSTLNSLVHLIPAVAAEQVALREEIKAHLNICRHV